MEYTGYLLKDDILIDRLYTVHYFEFSSDYSFVGEAHDFWEFVYVDSGEIICTAGDTQRRLTRGDVIFHKPKEWHSIRANKKTASDVVIVSFSTGSEAMHFFENKILKTGQEQKKLLSKIITEFKNSFDTPLNELYTYKLIPSEDCVTGSNQLLKQYICEFLILGIRGASADEQYTTLNRNLSGETIDVMINYMNENIGSAVTVDDLAKASGTNKMTVNRVFRSYLNTTPIKYFIYLKTELAKKYLRENNYNITQIAEMLGYSNIHYFSQQFKKEVGMSPTEYTASIRAISEFAKGDV